MSFELVERLYRFVFKDTELYKKRLLDISDEEDYSLLEEKEKSGACWGAVKRGGLLCKGPKASLAS